MQFYKLWAFLYTAFAKHLPGSEYPNLVSRLSSKIRVFLLKRWAFEGVGENITVHENVLISGKKSITGGDNWGFGRGCSIYAMGGLYIGSHVMFGPGVTIITTNHRYGTQFDPSDHFIEEKPVKIKDDVWIGANVTILAGVNIEKGSYNRCVRCGH